MTDATCNGRALAGIIRGTGFSVTVDDSSFKGLVQAFELDFTRRIQRIYDLASPSFYYIEYPPEGQVAFTKVVGPLGAQKLVCDCQHHTITLSAGTLPCFPKPTGPADPNLTWTLTNAMPFNERIHGNASDFLIVFSIAYVFSDLQ